MSQLYERVLVEGGFRIRCRITDSCPYLTATWTVDDGSAEENFFQHKWAKHEPETPNPR